MSMARTVLTVAAALVVVPIAMRARERGSAMAARETLSRPAAEQRDEVTAADLRAYLQAIGGSNPVQCEIVLSSFNSWSSTRAPDRDSTAWKVTLVVHRTFSSEALVPELVAGMRSNDACVSRVSARLLGRSRLPAAKSALMAALSDENPELRRLAAIGIGFSNDTTASRSLVRALRDRDERVRAAAAWALGAVN